MADEPSEEKRPAYQRFENNKSVDRMLVEAKGERLLLLVELNRHA